MENQKLYNELVDYIKWLQNNAPFTAAKLHNTYAGKHRELQLNHLCTMSELNIVLKDNSPLDIIELTREVNFDDNYFYFDEEDNDKIKSTNRIHFHDISHHIIDNDDDLGNIDIRKILLKYMDNKDLAEYLDSLWTNDPLKFSELYNSMMDSSIYPMEQLEIVCNELSIKSVSDLISRIDNVFNLKNPYIYINSDATALTSISAHKKLHYVSMLSMLFDKIR